MKSGFDDRDRESVERDLENPDEEVRRLAVERVDALLSADAVPRLAERLGDPSWRVRKAAIGRLLAASGLPAESTTTPEIVKSVRIFSQPVRRTTPDTCWPWATSIVAKGPVEG